MSLRIDTAELITGAYVIGETGLGVLGSAVPSTGEHGASYLYNDLSLPADNDKEMRGLIVTPPSDGTFYAWEDGSFSLVGAADGEYTFVYRLYVDGVDSGTATATIIIGAGGGSLSGDATFAFVTTGGGGESQPAVITTPPFRNTSGTLLPSTTIPKVVVLRLSDMSTVLNLTNQVTNGSGILVISNAALSAGTTYLVVSSNSDATAYGCEPVAAA